MDLGAAIDWLQAFPVLSSIRDSLAFLFRLLPWIGTGLFVWAVLDPVRWDVWLPAIRNWLKGVKTVATELDAKVDARLDAQDAKLNTIILAIESLKPKVPA